MSGRVPTEPGSRPTDQAPQAGLDAPRIDPSRSAICDVQDELRRRQSAIATALVASKAVEWLGKYGREALRDRGFARTCEGADEAGKYALRAMAELADEINGRAMALAEADVAAAFSDSDRSGEADETPAETGGSAEGESAGRSESEGIAQTPQSEVQQ